MKAVAVCKCKCGCRHESLIEIGEPNSKFAEEQMKRHICKTCLAGKHRPELSHDRTS